MYDIEIWSYTGTKHPHECRLNIQYQVLIQLSFYTETEIRRDLGNLIQPPYKTA